MWLLALLCVSRPGSSQKSQSYVNVGLLQISSFMKKTIIIARIVGKYKFEGLREAEDEWLCWVSCYILVLKEERGGSKL